MTSCGAILLPSHCITTDEGNCDMSKYVKGKQKEAAPQAKRFRGPESSTAERGPLGLKWDGNHYSCGYDSFFTIIYNMYME
jgi:hypothetical protein